MNADWNLSSTGARVISTDDNENTGLKQVHSITNKKQIKSSRVKMLPSNAPAQKNGQSSSASTLKYASARLKLKPMSVNS